MTHGGCRPEKYKAAPASNPGVPVPSWYIAAKLRHGDAPFVSYLNWSDPR